MNEIDTSAAPEIDNGEVKRREVAMDAMERYQKAVGNSNQERLAELEKKAEEIRLEFRTVKSQIDELKSKPNLEDTGMQVMVQLLEMFPDAGVDFLVMALEKKFGPIPKSGSAAKASVRPEEPSKQTTIFSRVSPVGPGRKSVPRPPKASIMAALSTKPEPISRVESVMGWTGSRNHLRDALTELVQEGKVIREGEKHSTTYRRA
jgi:hypothetical protein